MFRIISNGNILQTGNAIVEAQKRSSLYDTSKLAADPLIADKKEIAKTAGKGWFDIQVRTMLDGSLLPSIMLMFQFIHTKQPLKIDSKVKADIRMIQMRNYMDPKRYGYLSH